MAFWRSLLDALRGGGPRDGGASDPGRDDRARASNLPFPAGGAPYRAQVRDFQSTGINPGLFVLAEGWCCASSLALDSANVYWTDPFARTVAWLPKEGGDPQLVTSDTERPAGVAVDAAGVYVTDAARGTVTRYNKDGTGEPEVLARGQRGASEVRVHDGQVYWLNADSGRGDGAVMRVPATGGTPEALAARLAEVDGLLVHASGVYCVGWSTDLAGPGVLRVLGGDAVPGARPELVVPLGVAWDEPDQPRRPRLGADDARLYWTEPRNGALAAVECVQGADAPPPLELPSGLSSPTFVAADADAVYVIAAGPSLRQNPYDLLRLAKHPGEDGRRPRTVLAQLDKVPVAPGQFACDEACVYLATGTKILKVRK